MTSDVNDDSLKLSFSRLQTDFLDAVQRGPADTEAFQSRFSELHDIALNRIDHSSSPPEHTLAIAHGAALNIAAIAQGLIEFDEKSSSLFAELETDLADIFTSLSLGTTNDGPEAAETPAIPNRDTECKNVRSACRERVLSKASQYNISEVYRWVLANIHNPYPSSTTKRQLHYQSAMSIKSINDCLSSIRKRIGWTAISKRFFQGDRNLTVDCAQRIFVEGTGYLHYSEEILRKFKEMEATAERLYGEKKGLSDLAGKMDTKVVTNTWTYNESPRSQRGRKGSYVYPDYTDPDEPIAGPMGTGLFYVGMPGTGTFGLEKSLPATGRKRQRDSCGDDAGGDSDQSAAPRRMLKKLRSFRTSSSRSVSRASSFSSSTLSRASSTDLQTPNQHLLPLPIMDDSYSIDSWLTAISAECQGPQVDYQGNNVFDSSKKRRGSETDLCRSPKRARFGNNTELIEQPSASFGFDDNFDALDFLSQLDFNIPPAVSFPDDMNAAQSLSISMFDSASLVNTGYEDHVLNEIGGSSVELQPVNASASPPLRSEPTGTHGHPGVISSETSLHSQTLSLVPNVFKECGEESHTYPTTHKSIPHPSSEVCDSLSRQNQIPCDPQECANIQLNELLKDADSYGVDQMAKLNRINMLLSEAARLHEEVFG